MRLQRASSSTPRPSLSWLGRWRPRPARPGPVLGALVLIACIPSLVLNAGLGRGFVFHQHDDGRLHGHLVAPSVHEGHVHWHADGFTHAHHADPQHPDAPDEHRDEGALIRGAEITLKRNDLTSDFSAFAVNPILFLLTLDTPPIASPPAPASSSHDEPLAEFHLASLRSVILLI